LVFGALIIPGEWRCRQMMKVSTAAHFLYQQILILRGFKGGLKCGPNFAKFSRGICWMGVTTNFSGFNVSCCIISVADWRHF
jgi:hypothetical protein